MRFFPTLGRITLRQCVTITLVLISLVILLKSLRKTELKSSLEKFRERGYEYEVRNALVKLEQECERTRKKIFSFNQMCPCVPETLRSVEFKQRTLSLTAIQEEFQDKIQGQPYSPVSCIPRWSVAVFIIYRPDEEQSFIIAIRQLHFILRKQLLEFQIFSLKQQGERQNDGYLYNAGFQEATKLWPNFDCLIFYDSQLLLLDDRNILSCSFAPRDVGTYVDSNNYTNSGYDVSNGIFICSKLDFVRVNGFTNSFFDSKAFFTDFMKRLEIKLKRYVKRLPFLVSTATSSIRWKRPNLDDSQYDYSRFNREHLYTLDGLSSTHYSLTSRRLRPLFTELNIKLYFNLFENFEKKKQTCDGVNTNDGSFESLISKMSGTLSDCAITCSYALDCIGFVYHEFEHESFNCFLVQECLELETLPDDAHDQTGVMRAKLLYIFLCGIAIHLSDSHICDFVIDLCRGYECIKQENSTDFYDFKCLCKPPRTGIFCERLMLESTTTTEIFSTNPSTSSPKTTLNSLRAVDLTCSNNLMKVNLNREEFYERYSINATKLRLNGCNSTDIDNVNVLFQYRFDQCSMTAEELAGQIIFHNYLSLDDNSWKLKLRCNISKNIPSRNSILTPSLSDSLTYNQ
ncbi:DgyrCDS4303 [Dimorphilus gyrociliatus]|uniref:DgyrCDS4303 n=1 Tax=Dimorphilus gyrociliatus TaxID=2664684 RepID=A0A7I8VJ66_9ANNE|nr:DgyrCDS4303 [Dimorphilus gyrociliatus]